MACNWQLSVRHALQGASDTFSNKNAAVISSSLHFFFVFVLFVLAVDDLQVYLHLKHPLGRQLFVLQALRNAFDTSSNGKAAVMSSSLHFWAVWFVICFGH